MPALPPRAVSQLRSLCVFQCCLACHKKCLETLAIQCGHKKLQGKLQLFGQDFTAASRGSSDGIPFLIRKCISEIEKRAMKTKVLDPLCPPPPAELPQTPSLEAISCPGRRSSSWFLRLGGQKVPAANPVLTHQSLPWKLPSLACLCPAKQQGWRCLSWEGMAQKDS